MYKPFLQIAAIAGALSVALGAFGAHALKKLANETALNIFETSVRYQFYHVFAVAVAGILYKEFPGKCMIWSGYLFLTGMLLFCGSLYVLTYAKAVDKSSLNWIGAITPLGGVAFIAGWICLFTGLACTQSK